MIYAEINNMSSVVVQIIKTNMDLRTAISTVEKQIAAGHLVAPKQLLFDTLGMMRGLLQTEFMRLTGGCMHWLLKGAIVVG